MNRLRWRLRGATMWPAFVVATLVESFLWHWLPAAGDGPDYFLGAFLIAMALNLIVVAAIAPAAGALWRRQRGFDLPRAIATDQAGTVLVGVLLVATVVVGIVHRASLVREDRDRQLAYVAASTYVHHQRPELRSHLDALNAIQVEGRMWRACVPTDRVTRSLCLFVDVGQSPAGVTRDHDQTPNNLWRR